MRRIALILAGFLLSAIALFALIIALLPREVMKARMGEQIASWTGREVSVRGEPEIDIFPRLSVTLNDVRVGAPEGMEDAQILEMDRLTGTIRLLPLLIGQIEVGSFTLVRPLVRLVRDAEGRRNWEFDSSAAALQLAFAGDVPLGDFALEGGTFVLEDRGSGETERLDSVSLAIEWTSVRQPIQVTGSGIWRGEQVTLSANADAPFSFLNGASTPLDARIDAAPISMVFTGEARDYPTPELTGALRLSTPSLRRFASWLGSAVGPGSTLGPASLFGTAALRDGVLSVENAEFTLDGNSASGALTIMVAAKPDIAGTLAFGALDLTPYFAGLSTAIATNPDWRKVEIPTGWFENLTADVRLSADLVTLGDLSAGDTAASVTVRDGRTEIGLARAIFDSGSLAGDLAMVDRADAASASVEAQLRATDINLAAAAPLLGLPPAVSGTTSLAVDVTAQGDDLGTLVGSLGGTVRLDVQGGSIPLLGIAGVAAAASGASDPLSADGLAPVPIQSASVGLSFSGGIGSVERASVVAASYSADASGLVGLFDGGLRLDGVVHPGAPGLPAESEIPFTIVGTLANPTALPLADAN